MKKCGYMRYAISESLNASFFYLIGLNLVLVRALQVKYIHNRAGIPALLSVVMTTETNILDLIQ